VAECSLGGSERIAREFRQSDPARSTWRGADRRVPLIIAPARKGEVNCTSRVPAVRWLSRRTFLPAAGRALLDVEDERCESSCVAGPVNVGRGVELQPMITNDGVTVIEQHRAPERPPAHAGFTEDEVFAGAHEGDEGRAEVPVHPGSRGGLSCHGRVRTP
jgi:hypothetical protein